MQELLYALEFTPKHIYFIMCTSRPDELKKKDDSAFFSRCMEFSVNKLKYGDMSKLLERVLKAEEVDDIPDKTIDLIINKAEGNPRQALVLLDKIIDLDFDDMEKVIKNFKTEEAKVKDLIDALLQNKTWKIIKSILKNLDSEPERTRDR